MTAEQILDELAELLRNRHEPANADSDLDEEDVDEDEDVAARAADDGGGLTLRVAQELSRYLRLDTDQRSRLNRWLAARGAV